MTPPAHARARGAALVAAVAIALALARGRAEARPYEDATPARADDVTHTCVQDAHEGQRARDAGRLREARDAFARCRADRCPAVVRESCEGWATEVEARLPGLVLGARDPAGADLTDVRVAMDGAPLAASLDGRAVDVDPGPHELSFEAPGRVTVRLRVLVREGERVRSVVAVLPPRDAAPEPTPPRPSLVPLVVTGSVAAAGFTTFAVLGLVGQGERRDLERTCATSRTCAPDDVTSARTKLLVADVGLVAGLAGAGAFAVFALLRPSSAPAGPVSFGAAPLPGGGAAFLRLAR